MENIQRMQHIYQQVDPLKFKKSQKEYFDNLHTKKIEHSKSQNQLANSIYNNNFSNVNNIIPSPISRNPNNFSSVLGKNKNLTSNDIIDLSKTNNHNKSNMTTYSGYRFNAIKNIAEFVELNGTYRKKVPTRYNDNFQPEATARSFQIRAKSPWQKILDKTPDKFIPQIKISEARKREIIQGKRVLIPQKNVKLLV